MSAIDHQYIKLVEQNPSLEYYIENEQYVDFIYILTTNHKYQFNMDLDLKMTLTSVKGILRKLKFKEIILSRIEIQWLFK